MKEAFPAWRERLHSIIFLADTRAGRSFDIVLIAVIIASVAVVLAESSAVTANLVWALRAAEWVFTCIFLIEYLLRLITVRDPRRYVVSFFGIIDLLAVLPAFVALVLPGTHYLAVLRLLRVLRVFRVLKLVPYMAEAAVIVGALRASRRKITVFLFSVLIIAVILGSLIYVIEGGENGFTSIPQSMYWAIVTLTTVGYGDVTPRTGLGQSIAAVIMILGYGIIAVPTGLVTAEVVSESLHARTRRRCGACGRSGHEQDAAFCRHCAAPLAPPATGGEDARERVNPRDAQRGNSV